MVGVNDLLKNEPLGKYTTFKIGGPADYFYDAKTADDFMSAILFGRKHNLPVFILGGGTNILVGDRGIRGFVIKNSTHGISMKGMRGTVSGGDGDS